MAEPKSGRAVAKPKFKRESDDPKVFDVRRPGRAPATATSRPVIIGHKPQVKDPMVSESEPKRAQRMSTTALHDSKLPDMAHKATVTPTSSSPATQQPSSKSSTPVKPTDPSTLPNPDVPAMLSQFDDERSGQAVNSQAESSHRPDAPLPAKASDMSSRQPLDSVVQAQPPPAPITESDRIIESTAPPEVDMSRAVVSHAIRSKRRPGRMLVLWLGLLVVLIVAADVMLDSGAVKPSFQLPHTHFLRNP